MLRTSLRKGIYINSRLAFAAGLQVQRPFSSFRVLLQDDSTKNTETNDLKSANGHTHTHQHQHSNDSVSYSGHSHSDQAEPGDRPLKMDKPMLMFAFTCKKCDTRSSHVVSKQAYQHGTVLVQCPGCKVRHLMADHLKIFSDHRITLEDIMKAQGESITTGTEDLMFEDIPESLKNLLGHHAKDAPPEYKKTPDNDEPQKLSHPKK